MSGGHLSGVYAIKTVTANIITITKEPGQSESYSHSDGPLYFHFYSRDLGSL